MSQVKKMFEKLYLIIHINYIKILTRLNPVKSIETLYFKSLKKNLNLTNPITFNEKINWLKLYDNRDVYAICADKIKVRQYVSDRVNSNILNEVYGIYQNPDEINYISLPDEFVLKVNHGTGQNYIVHDKSLNSWNKIKKQLSLDLKKNQYYYGAEWAYKNIPPGIICEKLLKDDDGKVPIDYKFFCFNGEVKIIQVDLDRFGNHKRNMYNEKWELLDFEYCYPNGGLVKKPTTFDEMVKIANTLSRDFPFVRVDFYEINSKVIFGEMTFYPENGFGKFNPPKFDNLLGNYLNL